MKTEREPKTTTEKIAEYSKTKEHETLVEMLEYYGKSGLRELSEEQKLAYLKILEEKHNKSKNYEDQEQGQ